MFSTLSEEVVDGHYKKITLAIKNAFDDFIELENETIDKGIDVKFEARTKGSLIHDLMKFRIREQYESDKDIKIGEFNGIFGILIKDVAFIRFKKLSDKFNTSNIQTKQTVNYNNQSEIEGLPTVPVKLYAGYLPNATWTAIDNVYLFCREGSNITWSVDLTGSLNTQTNLFEAEEESKAPELKITIKRNEEQPERKTGTE